MSIQDDFTQWATAKGLDSNTIRQVIACAATPEEFKQACEEDEACSPIYPLEEIQSLQEGDEMGVSPEKSGFLIVGSCPNGDPIALDTAADPGSVWYMGHETMHSKPLRSIAIRVADNLVQFINNLVEDDDFPFDYYSAKDQLM